MKVSAIVPTIIGREALLQRTLESLRETTEGFDIELLIIRNSPTVGEGWNKGAEAATGDYLWLAADDVTMHSGWLETVIEKEAEGVYPCPRILHPDGEIEACGTLGQTGCILQEVRDGFPCGASSFPFVSRETWDVIGPSLPIGYFADDYLGFRARVAGLDVSLARGYSLTHHAGVPGREMMIARWNLDRTTFLSSIAEQHAWREAVPA